jgi:hypothetical protein
MAAKLKDIEAEAAQSVARIHRQHGENGYRQWFVDTSNITRYRATSND